MSTGFWEYWSAYPVTSNIFDELFGTHLGAVNTWGNSDAYLVQIGAICKVMDNPATTLQVYKGNKVIINSTALNLGTTALTWVYTTSSSINTANYKVSCGDLIDVRVTRTASTATSRNLTMSFWFVLE